MIALLIAALLGALLGGVLAGWIGIPFGLVLVPLVVLGVQAARRARTLRT